LSAAGPDADKIIQEIIKSLGSNLKTTYVTEGELLTATTTLSIEGSVFTDLSRSLGLQSRTAMQAAKILFILDEYYGIATNLDPSKPVLSEVEYFADRSSSASGSNFSDTSSKAARSESLQGSIQASSTESSSVAARDRASVSAQASSSVEGRDRVAVAGKSESAVAARDRVAVAGQSESAVAARDRGAIAGQGSYGSVAGSRDRSVAAAERNQFAGSRDTSVAAAQRDQFAASRDTSVSADQRSQMAASRDSSVAAASSSDARFNASVNSASASSSDNQNVQASSFAKDQKNVVSFKSKTVFPDVNNAKPDQSTFIVTRLAEVTSQYGIRYTPELDIRETGKGKMLISDIETQGKWTMYRELAAKPPYSADYIVFGKAAMNAEGKTSSGQTICSGQLQLTSFNTSTGDGLVSGTVVKRAEGSSDQLCRASLSTALATELAQTVGSAASRELQLSAGQVFSVTLYSGSGISRRLGGAFEDTLRKLAQQDLKEQSRDKISRAWTVQWKGQDLSRRIELVLDALGPDMVNAEVESSGSTIFVCVEGKCPPELKRK
jgi:hypothetical protein